jgi:hypothetical protein
MTAPEPAKIAHIHCCRNGFACTLALYEPATHAHSQLASSTAARSGVTNAE